MTNPLWARSNPVRPAVWRLARVNGGHLGYLGQRIAETEARSTVLVSEVIALIAAGAEPREHTSQLWDTLDTLQRLRAEQWVLSQA